MDKRPDLNCKPDSNTFLSFYYLKEELVAFCRENGLPASGSKADLTARIAHYLDTGECLPAAAGKKKAPTVTLITEDMPIEENLVCSEQHRAFFRERIGKSFSFTVAFQNWLKENCGKTYRDAIAAYAQIQREKRHTKTTISQQFEYNTYIRDFFAANPGKQLADAIACWKYKKAKCGHNRYEPEDLAALAETAK